jgi:hypothetical protein
MQARVKEGALSRSTTSFSGWLSNASGLQLLLVLRHIAASAADLTDHRTRLGCSTEHQIPAHGLEDLFQISNFETEAQHIALVQKLRQLKRACPGCMQKPSPYELPQPVNELVVKGAFLIIEGPAGDLARGFKLSQHVQLTRLITNTLYLLHQLTSLELFEGSIHIR